jgi:hypothetical protein
MANPLKTGVVVAFSHAQKAGKKDDAQPSKMQRDKAKHAFHNAKQRCQNPKNPSYSKYGGAGIKVLLGSVDDLVKAIGWPASSKVSLERINPQGHYEPGNIRWASKTAQAHNKVGSPLATLPPLEKLVAQHKATLDNKAHRDNATDAWSLVIDGLNRGYFFPSDAEKLATLAPHFDPTTAGWELGQEPDFADAPSYFFLPSITMPGKVVRLRGGPFSPAPSSPSTEGTLAGLGRLNVSWNIFPTLLDWMNEDAITNPEFGAVWVGQVANQHLKWGGVEGQMLALASRLRRNNKRAKFAPLRTVLIEMSDLGSLKSWAEEFAPVLDAKFLFIPDFQIDVGVGSEPSPYEWSALASLLEYRANNGRLTFVGVQNPHKLPPRVAKAVLGRLRVREWSALKDFNSHPMTPSKAAGPVQKFKHGLNFAGLAAAMLEHSTPKKN